MEPEKFLTHAEFNSLLKAAKDDRERCILLLLAGAGLRVSEMTQIRAEDVDFSKDYLHVRAINAKFKKLRTVVLLPQVAQAISKLLAGRSKGWLFPSYRDRIHPHILRHSFAVWSLDGGVPVGDLQDQLGHASLATTGIYLKASPNHRRESYMRSGLSNILAEKTP